ncbi:MAG: Na-translocating system protein MpsC family protein [Gammaproteobacteria bacterium]
METHPGARSANSEICDAAVRLLREYTGRGPTKARATINTESVLIVLGDTLTRGERRLAETGKADRVLELRHDFQMVMREELIQAVEAATGRKVIAFMSQNHIDPDLAAEVFILQPEGSADGASG